MLDYDDLVEADELSYEEVEAAHRASLTLPPEAEIAEYEATRAEVPIEVLEAEYLHDQAVRAFWKDSTYADVCAAARGAGWPTRRERRGPRRGRVGRPGRRVRVGRRARSRRASTSRDDGSDSSDPDDPAGRAEVRRVGAGALS